MSLRERLGTLYAKSMVHFGCGNAMFEPVSAADMQPPCIGYLDDHGRWNLIAKLGWLGKDGPHPVHNERLHDFSSLERTPRKLEEVGIEWRPRTSIGVRQWTADAEGHVL